MKKNYIIDTNVLLEDDKCIEILRNDEENNVIIPYSVIQELDGLKRDPKKRELVFKAVNSIIANFDFISFLPDREFNNTDSCIVDSAKDNKSIKKPIIISNDKIFHLLCKIKKVDVEEYITSKPIQSESESYNGFIKSGDEVIPNSFEWVDGKVVYHSGNNGDKIVDHNNEIWCTKPKNIYQNLAMELILDPDINLVTIQSTAGYGKTHLSLAASMHLVFEEHKYGKIYVLKSPVEIGPSIGFIPGEISEKLDPYYRPIYDIMIKLFSLRKADKLYECMNKNRFNKNLFEILPLSFIRGMNIDNSIVVIDECQNISRHEMRSILTRMGDNVKCICIGDTKQVDNNYLNEFNNGLNWTVALCKGQKNYGHMVLKGNKSRGPITDLILKVGL